MSSDLSASCAVAVKLPPELIYNILNHVVSRNPFLKLWSYDKQGLSACSLTCRHWAGVIRPALFSTIVLRQPGDISKLLEFLDSEISVGPALSNCIENLTLEVEPTVLVRAVPCLQHYCKLVKRLYVLARLHINNCQSPITGGPLSQLDPFSLSKVLSSSLPKTLPGTMFPVSELMLSSLRLRSVADLVHTVNSLPTVQVCRCSHVVFGEGPATPHLPVRRRLSRLHTVDISECGDGRLETQVELCSMVADVRERLGFSVDALAGCHDILLTVPDGPRGVFILLNADPTRE
jgi:hypothetical protein